MQRTVSATRVAAVIGETRWDPPRYAALAGRLRAAITDGRLPGGVRMPSERDLMSTVGLSRTTVSRAYELLRDQGYLLTRQGSGSVVRLPSVPGGRVDHLLTPQRTARGGFDLTTTAGSAGPWLLPAYRAATEALEGYLPGTGYYPTGLPVLRAAVARRYHERGLATTPEQIVITTGALSGIAITVQAFLRPGDRVVVESPTYPNAIATLQGARVQVVPHPVDRSVPGAEWDPEGFGRLARQVSARSAYLVPDFHNPTGALMDTAQRERLGATLRGSSVVPIIDESAVELALDDVDLPPPLAAFVPDAVTVGGVSKAYWGGLRIGWLRLPPARVEALALTRLRSDLGAPVLEQLVVAALMEQHAAVIAERVTRLRRARDVLLSGVITDLPSWRVTPPHGGLTLWCELPRARSTALVGAAAELGVHLAAGPNFAPQGGLDRWIRLPFALPEDDLRQVPPLLARAWAAAQGQQPDRRHRPAPIIA